jgi:hypothetical protein
VLKWWLTGVVLVKERRSEMTLTDKILKVLTLVPLPLVPQAAQIVQAVLLVSHEAHAEAAAAGLPPPTVAELEAALAEALTLAQEPWRRIQAKADAELKRPGNDTRE